MNASGQLIEGTIAEKTRRCIQNLQLVLENAGSDLLHVMKVNVRQLVQVVGVAYIILTSVKSDLPTRHGGFL